MRAMIWSLAAAVGVATLASPAVGFWRAAGSSGAGAGAVATTSAVQVAPGTTTNVLYPTGVATGDVALRLTNGNPFAVTVPRLTLDTSRGRGGFAVDAAHSACALSSLAYTTQTNGGAGWRVPASSTVDVDLARALVLSTSAADDCQGATFTVYLTS